MQRKKPGVDIVLDILEEAQLRYPDSDFIRSLHHQYLERGGLSRKQLEGLYQKAAKITGLAPQKLATLEAIILKKPVKSRSELPANKPLYHKDEGTLELINAILLRHPGHKRVQFFKARVDNNEMLSPAELSELQRFHKLLA